MTPQKSLTERIGQAIGFELLAVLICTPLLAWLMDKPLVDMGVATIAIGLIALFTSYDHLTILGHRFSVPQSWGIPFIAASVAIVFVDAQLATGSRLRAAHAALRAAQDAARAEDETARERDRAARASQLQARAVRAGALVWLEPSLLHR